MACFCCRLKHELAYVEPLKHLTTPDLAPAVDRRRIKTVISRNCQIVLGTPLAASHSSCAYIFYFRIRISALPVSFPFFFAGIRECQRFIFDSKRKIYKKKKFNSSAQICSVCIYRPRILTSFFPFVEKKKRKK